MPCDHFQHLRSAEFSASLFPCKGNIIYLVIAKYWSNTPDFEQHFKQTSTNIVWVFLKSYPKFLGYSPEMIIDTSKKKDSKLN